MSLTNAETFGFCNQFVQFLVENKDELQANGLDVTLWITELIAQNAVAVTKDAAQDETQVLLKVQAAETRTAVKVVYQNTSTRLDAAIGVLGKTTPLAKQAAKLRSSLMQKSKKKSHDSGKNKSD